MSSRDIDFTVIIPHRDTLHFLPKLFHSLPESDRIEILLIDNSFAPITREDVDTDKKFKLLYSSPERGAGGARNEGLEHAHGKWLIFVDADDYLPEDAFEIFYNNFNSDAEVIYYGMDGIYADTGERSD
jgi:glycosyltransferase involved in cell wall biosynthesis